MLGENGILTLDSGKSGKKVTIVACTHADEIIGFEVVKYLLSEFDIKNKIISWKLTFVFGNQKAFEIGKKYVDKDFNRIWDFKEEDKETYEYKRALEIKETILDSDFLLDQHSTTNKSPFFLIPFKDDKKNILKNLNVDFIVEDILDFLHGKPLIKYVSENNKNCETLVMECFYEGKKDFENYTNNVISWLNQTWIISENLPFEVEKRIPKTIKVTEAKYAESMEVEFLYSEKPKSFDEIKVWQKVYSDNQKIFEADEDFVILMPTKPRYIWEEIMYKAKKV